MCRNFLHVSDDEKKELVRRYFTQFYSPSSSFCPTVRYRYLNRQYPPIVPYIPGIVPSVTVIPAIFFNLNFQSWQPKQCFFKFS
jgi:hypothetical protein